MDTAGAPLGLIKNPKFLVCIKNTLKGFLVEFFHAIIVRKGKEIRWLVTMNVNS